MDNFFQRIKEVRDRLSSVAVFINEEELIHLVLEALPQEYGAFCSTIRTRNDVFTKEELNTLLNAEERAIKKNLCVGILLWLWFFKVGLIRTIIEAKARMVIKGVMAEVLTILALILVSTMAKHL